MDFRVGRVLELLQQEIARIGRRQFLGLLDRTAHAVGAGCQDQFGAEAAQQRATLLAHRFGHRQHDLVAARGGDHGERDAGIAAGRFDEDGVGLDQAGFFGRADHRFADAVLDAVRRVEEFELGGNGRTSGRAGAVMDAVDADERRVADEVGDGIGDVHLVFLQGSLIGLSMAIYQGVLSE